MLKILLVDDDTNVLQCLKMLVPWEELDYCVVGCAIDGNEAFEIAKVSNPDVIITDIKMPFMDGIDLCIKIRETLPITEIIFLSAYEDFYTAQIAIKHSVRDYILKPIDIEKLEYLGDILRKIASKHKKSDWLNNFLSSDNTLEITEKLNEGNWEYFEQIFDELGEYKGEISLASAMYIKLFNTIYVYLNNLGIKNDIIEKERTKRLAFLKSCNNITDIVQDLRQSMFNIVKLSANNNLDLTFELVGKIKGKIDESFSEPGFSTRNLAEIYNYSADYISRIFKQYTGNSIGIYIIEKRMEYAKKLLAETDIPIKKIAIKTGYDNVDYFTKAFRSNNNITPTEYRLKINATKEYFNS